MDIGHEIISTAILSLPLIQVGQLYDVHLVLVNRLGSLPRNSVVRLTDVSLYVPQSSGARLPNHHHHHHQTIRDWNALPDSKISSAEVAEDWKKLPEVLLEVFKSGISAALHP